MGSLYKRTFTTADGTIRERPTWWLKYYQNGRAIRESTGTTKETVARLGRLTFEEAAADIQNEYQVNGRRSIGELERRIRLHLKPVFGARRMAAITTADVRTFIRGRQEHRASNAEINRELAVLKRMYSLAVQGQKLHHRPYIPMLQENNVRTGFFEAEQFTALLSHLPAELQPVMQFAYITGWRIASEVLTLEWRQVDFTAGTVRLDPGTTKNRGVGAGLHGFGLSEDADPLASSTAAGAQFPREFEGAPEVQDEISRRKLARVRTSPRGARRRDTLALRRRDGRVETCAVWSAGRAEEILGPRDRDRIDAPARLPVALAPDRGLLAVGPGLDAPRPRSARSHHALAAESAPRSRSRSHSGPGASSSHRRQHGPVDRRRGRMGRGETRGTRQARLEEAPSRCRPIRRDRCPSADRADGR